MKRVSVIVVVVLVLCAPATATPATNSPFASVPIRRPFRTPTPGNGATPRSAPVAHGSRFDASCAGGTHGSYAFDSSTEFMTNFTMTEVFGEGNLAAGEASGALEGYSNIVCEADGVIAGGNANLIDAVNGPAYGAFIGGGDHGTVTGLGAFLGGGHGSTVAGSYAFGGAGSANMTGGYAAGIAAGQQNSVTGDDSFAGAGSTNIVNGADSFAGAGGNNTLNADDAFLGSGVANTIAVTATYGSVLGGSRNAISGKYASILGGYGNSASGAYAIVAGGDGDSASGTVSFAGGYHAGAVHNGSFVWSDYSSGSSPIKDAAANQFVVRASGGTYVYSNEAATVGVKLAAGSGTWASLSDRNSKADVAPLDDASILAKVNTLPVSSWRYKGERGVRHAGPMAQDFYSAFGVGEDDHHIAATDEDGVALAAIKALSQQLRELRNQNVRLQARLAALESDRHAAR